ncbi:MAG: BatA and WFA domain-containing protein [Verrucomicrobiota bacterium]
MQILQPTYLYLALLGLIPLALYFFRRKSRTVPVSTLVFFKSLAKEHQESAWLRHLKKVLSLLLTLLVLGGVIFALARPVFAPKTEGLESIVVLLDRSASMNAVDGSGENRLEAAKAELRTRLAGVPEDVGVSLMVYDGRPELLLPKSYKRRQLLALVDQVDTRPVPDDEEKAMGQARMIASLDEPAEIWHFTDREAAEVERDESELAIRERRFPMGLEAPTNAGITAFQVRKVPLVHSRYEVYVRVMGASSMSGAGTAEMEIKVGGVPVQIRELDIEPGVGEGIILPLDGVAGQLLEIRLQMEGDCFSEDNYVAARLPEEDPLLVAWITAEADPFTELALSSIAEEGKVELWKGGAGSWPLDVSVDVVIFDGWLPEEWPEGVPAIVLNPPGSAGPVRAVALESGGIPHGAVRAANGDHPVLFRVNSGRVSLTQTAVLDGTGSLEPLWFAGGDPVLLAGEVRGQRLVIMAFSAERSERLPLMASYPLLLGNALFWCANAVRGDEVFGRYRTGEVIDVEDAAIRWRELTEAGFRDATDASEGQLIELDRVGLWEGIDGREGVSLLLSGQETDMRGVSGIVNEDGENAGSSVAKWFRGEAVQWLLWIVLGVLLLESWLFHRRAVY